MEKPLIKDLNEFLTVRCDEIDYDEVAPRYKEEDEQIDRIYKELREQLSEADKAKFLRLNDLHGHRMASAANAAFIRGYSECLQCILYLLTSK